MKKIAILAALFVTLSTPAFAQTPVAPGDRLAWDQAATTLAEASGYTYLIKIDNAATPTVIAPSAVTCTGTASPFVCSTAFPAATPGVQHTIVVASRVVVPPSGSTPATNVDSAYSAPFTFQFVIVPAVPANVRRG